MQMLAMQVLTFERKTGKGLECLQGLRDLQTARINDRSMVGCFFQQLKKGRSLEYAGQ
jgi:hypothetical protein